jgi:F0F1-type ATP synthase assembly protein I
MFGVLVVGMATGVLLLFRSLRRWKTPPAGKTPEAQQAESKLWSTRNFPSR